MCSKPKVDNTIQVQQLTEAAEARFREQERQARIKAGSAFIDDLFDGGIAGDGRLAEDATYDPARTYYTASGDVWRPLDPAEIFRNTNTGTYKAPTAEEQFAEMLKNGGLFTGTREVRGFDDAFYNDRKNAYLGYYQPQLDDQFKQASDQLTYALARAGTLNSTIAADKQADLKKKYDTQRAAILSQADADVAQQKSRIANEKSNLVSQLNATGDVDRAANEALARTQQMFNEKPAYNPLGDIFAGVAAGIGNYYNARQNTNLYNSYFGPRSGGSGGVYVVG